MTKFFSIVIPNYNGYELLKKNLPKVLSACQKWGKDDWEIVISDDASSDNSVRFIRENYPQVKIVENKVNLRFAQNCNTGVRKANGKIIILLNSDVVPKEDFLSPLLKHFQDDSVFAVGCKEKDTINGNTILSGRGIVKFKRGLALHKRADNQTDTYTSWVSGGSGAFDRDKWLFLGGMDKLFRPAYEEDRDLSYVALKHGWKILFEPKSLVFHHHEATNQKEFDNKKIQIISFKNQLLFVWKNITDLNYLIKHFFWLPYHLVFTSIRSRGMFLIGFCLALKQLPEVLKRRYEIKSLFIKKDRELI